MSDENNVTNNSTAEAIEVDKSAVVGMFADIGEDVSEVAGAGAEDSNSKDGDVKVDESAKAPDDSAKAPDKGTTGELEKKEQPEWINAPKLDPELQNFMKSQGNKYYDNGKINPEIFKNWREAVQFSTEARQSLANYKNQVSSLQKAEEVKEPITRDQVDGNYNESVEDLRALANLSARIKNGTITAEDAAYIDQHVNSEYSDLQKTRDQQLNEIRDIEFAKKHGLTPKGDDGLESPEIAFNKANTVISGLLTKDEQTNSDLRLKVLGHLQPMVHKLAAALYPREFGKGEGEEMQKNSNTATYRVLASDPDIAKMLVEAGRNAEMVQTIESRVSDADKSGYERGKAEILKGVNGAGFIPSNNDVNGNGSNSGSVMAMHNEL